MMTKKLRNFEPEPPQGKYRVTRFNNNLLLKIATKWKKLLYKLLPETKCFWKNKYLLHYCFEKFKDINSASI